VRHRHDDPLEGARSSLQKLRKADDWNEATPVVHVNVQQPQPLARRTTAPPKGEGVIVMVVRVVGQGFQRMPPIGIVLIFAMLIAAWVFLAIHGKAPSPPPVR
jgi:hypothetical protein